MMNKIIFLMLILPNIIFGQISFFRTYSNDGFDRGEGVTQLPDSSYLVTGSSSSFNEDSKQAFIMQVDSLGNFLWSNHYGGNEADKGRRIFHVPNDGIYVIGQSNSYPNKFFDAYFFKTDLSGNLLFEKNYGGTSYEDIYDGVILKDTSFIVVGETSSTLNEVEDIFMMRLNKFGDTLWSKSFGTIHSDKAKSIKMLNDTIVYVVGEMYNVDLDKQQGMLIKMHINGTIEWTKLYGSESKHGFNDLNIFNDTIRMVGYTQRDLITQKNDYFRIICTLDGVYNDEPMAFFTGSHSMNGIQIFNNSELVISVSVKDEPSIPTYMYGCDNLIFKYNLPILESISLIKVSKPYDDIINQLITTNDFGVLIVGFNSELNFERISLLKIDGRSNFLESDLIFENSNLVTVNNVNSKKSINVFPNPASEIINIVTDEKIVNIQLFNNLNQKIIETQNDFINVNELQNGMYYLKIFSKNEIIQTKIIISN